MDEISDPLRRVTSFQYDTGSIITVGNVTAMTSPAGTTSFAYEPAFNQVTSIQPPAGPATTLGRDAKGNVTSIVDALEHETTITYNGSGQPLTVRDPLQHTTTFGYDAHGNLATITDPVGNVTTREYDAAGRLVKQIDPRGKATIFRYDALNRVTAIADALGGVTRFGYDGNGNLLTVTDARGNTTSHTYDSMDRLATRTDPVGATETFEYDGNGNLIRHVDRKGQTATFTYDPVNRRTAASYADGSTTFRYDAAGRLVRAADEGGTVENAYDAADRLIAQAQALGMVTYEYDALGRRRRMELAGSAPVVYDYDAASRVTSITQAPLSPVTFEYDAAGRRTKLTLPNQVSTAYQYDAAPRLTALIYRNAAGPLGELTYAYDALGNRTGVGGSFARTLLPNAIASATYDAANRQRTFGTQTLTYDANGSLTGDAVNSYIWDARNRLLGITGPSPATMAYDGLGRRSVRLVNGAWTLFGYDGFNPIVEVRNAGAADTLTGLGIDEYLVRSSVDGPSHLLVDALGTTVALADGDGIVRSEYTYEPFGRAVVAGFASVPFQYTGREDDQNGLYYYRARYYHPGLQRFVSEDPIGFEGGDINLYVYVLNSPIDSTDPSGTSVILTLPAECRNNPGPGSVPTTGGRKDGVLSAARKGLEHLVQAVVRTLDCDPTLDLLPGGVALAKGPIKAKHLFKSADALRRHNKQFRDVANQLNLTKEQREQLHLAITGERMSYHEVLGLAKSMFGK